MGDHKTNGVAAAHATTQDLPDGPIRVAAVFTAMDRPDLVALVAELWSGTVEHLRGELMPKTKTEEAKPE